MKADVSKEGIFFIRLKYKFLFSTYIYGIAGNFVMLVLHSAFAGVPKNKHAAVGVFLSPTARTKDHLTKLVDAGLRYRISSIHYAEVKIICLVTLLNPAFVNCRKNTNIHRLCFIIQELITPRQGLDGFLSHHRD